MTIKQVIAEVESRFPQYAEAGLIDRISLSRNIVDALRIFGNNIMVKTEAFIQIKGGKGQIPQDFWHLLIAVKADPFKYEVTKGTEDILMDSYFFKERTQHEHIWNAGLEEYVEEENTTIKEKFVFRRSEADFHYKPSYPLKLVKGFKREKCSRNSPYKSKDFARNSPYEINIYNNYLQTNFTNGTIYMQYYALPTDEEGDVIIPETQHSELKKYILRVAERNVLESVWYAEDDPNVQNKLQYALTQESEAKGLAQTETKMGALIGWKEDYIKRKRLQTQVYENLLPRV